MLMVIFGAGASYDSSPDFPPPQPQAAVATVGTRPLTLHFRELWRPPLANHLFSNPEHAYSQIVQRYPKLTHILPYLRQPSDGRSVEQVLELLQDQGKDYQERRSLSSPCTTASQCNLS